MLRHFPHLFTCAEDWKVKQGDKGKGRISTTALAVEGASTDWWLLRSRVLLDMASHDWNRKWSSPPTPSARPPQTPTTPLSSSRHVPSYTTASPYAQTAVPRTPLSRATSKQPWRDISEEEKQEIRMAFELFDLRNVGKLNYRELKVTPFLRIQHTDRRLQCQCPYLFLHVLESPVSHKLAIKLGVLTLKSLHDLIYYTT